MLHLFSPPLPYEESIRNLYVRGGGAPPQQAYVTGAQENVT